MAVAETSSDPLAVRLLYSPHVPEPPQHAFLLLDELEVEEALYGGAAGGGKSDCLLMAALRYVDVPGYAALLLRRTYPDLALPGAIMSRAKEWLIGKQGVSWSERDFRFTFDTGGALPATLSFGYLASRNDKYRYQSAEFQFIGFDELTQFEEEDYTYLFSRLRRPDIPDDAPSAVKRERELLAHVPLRMRVASNPGGRGHVWARRRFIEKLPSETDETDTQERADARVFIPAKLEDNPHVDAESYRRQLANLSRVERKRLEDGDWWADDGTLYFNGNDLDAVFALGDELEDLARRGELPPPHGDMLDLGLDFGDKTHGLLGYPLEAGGLWVIAGDELEGYEPGDATDALLGPPDAVGRDDVTFGLLAKVPVWPGRPRVRDPLRLVRAAKYDAAGLQSMRTFIKRARLRHRRLVAEKVTFGNYKREVALYLRHLAERAGEGHRTRVLAVSRRAAPDLARELVGLRKDAKADGTIRDGELWAKEDDHGPDALVALAARIAVNNRHRVEPRKRPPATSAGAIRSSQRP